MPNIPLITSQLRMPIQGVDAYARGQSFGTQVAGAIEGLGQEITSFGPVVDAAQDQNRKEQLQILNSNTDLVTPALAAQRDSPDGKGVAAKTFQEQKNIIDQTANTITDPVLRKQYVISQYARLQPWHDQSVKFEFDQAQATSVTEANHALDTLVNRVRVSANSYDDAIKDAYGLIDARSDIPAAQKEGMKLQMRSNLAQSRFEGQLAGANSESAYKALEAQFEDKKWQGEMSAQAFEQVGKEIKTSHNSFTAGMDAKAEAMAVSIKARLKANQRIPQAELDLFGKMVMDSNSPRLQLRYAAIMQSVSINNTYGPLSPAQIKAARDQQSQVVADTGPISKEISDAAALSGVSASYIAHVIHFESGGSATAKNPKSTASGAGQFLDATWLDMMHRYGPQAGIDTSKMTNEQILALKSDRALSIKMTGFYAMENKGYLGGAGIDANDTDLYLAHLLGPAGAVSFLKAMRATPNNSAMPTGDFTQGQININQGVFRGKRGTPRTYKEVYDNLMGSIAPGTTAVEFDRQQQLDNLYKTKQAAVNDNPITQYTADNHMTRYQLDTPDDFSRRARDAAGAASSYQIPIEEMKPFYKDEADTLSKLLKDGDANQRLQVLAYLKSMDSTVPGIAKGALKQLGEENTVLSYAGSLAFNKGMGGTATQIVRGEDKIKDKTYAGRLGVEGDALDAFNEVVGSSLAEVDNQMREAVYGAAKAHYMETYGAFNLDFNKMQFQASTRAVLGGTDQQSALGYVNKHITLLPPGLTGPEWDAALHLMTNQDFINMSKDKQPPLDAFGEVIDITDIDKEGRFQAIDSTGTKYKIMLADNKWVTTRGANGQLKAFIFTPNVQAMKFLGSEAAPEPRHGRPVTKPPGIREEDWNISPLNPQSPNYEGVTGAPSQ